LRDLDPLAKDLFLRTGCNIKVIAADLTSVDPGLLSLQIGKVGGRIDVLFIIAGTVDLQDVGEMDDLVMLRLVQVNFLSPIRIINALAPWMNEGAHLVVASSVAAIRSRSVNIVYGSAKRAFEHYVLGLALASRNRLGSVACYRLGYVRTNLNFGRKLPLPASSAEEVARAMVQGLGRRDGLIYFPAWWRLLAVILGCIPFGIYKRLKLP
jgi:decaprenylphospho-beta-D-erythro-pentofuranosid-2-ulose 2-reductase